MCIRDRPEGVRLIAHAPAGQLKPDWAPDPRMVINAGDRLTVVSRRAGLSWLLRQTAQPAVVPPPDGPTQPPLPGST